MAARSPLSQSQSADSGDDSGSGSETEAPSSKLAALALVEEVEIDVESLNPLSPEVICKQATINIGEFRGQGGEARREERGRVRAVEEELRVARQRDGEDAARMLVLCCIWEELGGTRGALQTPGEDVCSRHEVAALGEAFVAQLAPRLEERCREVLGAVGRWMEEAGGDGGRRGRGSS